MSKNKDNGSVTKVTEWKRPEATGKIPTKRSGHTLSLVESSIYLFGGCTAHASNGKPGTTNELFALDISQGNYHWTVPTTAGNMPDSRWHHTANVFDTSKIVYFGGFHDNVKRLNDVWVLDTVTLSWSQPVASAILSKISPDENIKNKLSVKPQSRGSHSATLVNKQLIVFGGYGGSAWARHDFNDLWALNLDTWSWEEIESSGEVPEERCGHSANLMNDQIFVVGGWNARPQERNLRTCLFTLCFYHSVIQGRRRFGQQGWSKKYSFNTGDLKVCGDVLKNWVGRNDEVPWTDIRYILAGIMYGGHITDYWDRRCNTTYLDVLLQKQIFSNYELGKDFFAPNPDLSVDEMTDYILNKLPRDSPPLYRLHPNAEIGYLSTTSFALFDTIMKVEKGGGGGGSGGGNTEELKARIDQLTEDLPERFNEVDVKLRAEPLLETEESPYVLVALQEVKRMNYLTLVMLNSMEQLKKGLNGELNMSIQMEELAAALTINQVPGRNIFHQMSWEKFAWPSKRSLDGWFRDLVLRIKQLQGWTEDLMRPLCVWISGLFNPMAFLTALMQGTGRVRSLALDNMTIETHVSIMQNRDKVSDHPIDGAYVDGLYIEGARWGGYTVEGANEEDEEEFEEEDLYEVSGTKCGGHILDSRLKELLPKMPVIYVKAVQTQASWIATEVGYIRPDPSIYNCPIYSTTFRGPTYIVLATLKSVEPSTKWVLAGVAMIMQEDL